MELLLLMSLVSWVVSVKASTSTFVSRTRSEMADKTSALLKKHLWQFMENGFQFQIMGRVNMLPALKRKEENTAN